MKGYEANENDLKAMTLKIPHTVVGDIQYEETRQNR